MSAQSMPGAACALGWLLWGQVLGCAPVALPAVCSSAPGVPAPAETPRVARIQPAYDGAGAASPRGGPGSGDAAGARVRSGVAPRSAAAPVLGETRLAAEASGAPNAAASRAMTESAPATTDVTAGSDTSSSLGRSARRGFAPDPAPTSAREWWLVELAYDAGRISVRSVQARRFPQERLAARRMGRFALELYVGAELLERVRFDFPLVSVDDVATGALRRVVGAPIRFAPGASSSRSVLLPQLPRALRAQLVDRATGAIYHLGWPLARAVGQSFP